MSDDNTQAPGAANDDEPAGGAEFNKVPWHVLIGLRVATNPANPSDMTPGLVYGMAAGGEVIVDTPAGPRPDKTNEAVHFAQWFERNFTHLHALWHTEYTQYMNLRRLSERDKPAVPGLRIVAADGKPVQ
jgi:hypothetical protein